MPIVKHKPIGGASYFPDLLKKVHRNKMILTRKTH